MSLEGINIAILAENGYEDLELWYPLYRLKEEGATVTVIGSGTSQTYKSKHGYPVKVDTNTHDAQATEYDGLIIPGGWAPDQMRRHQSMIDFVKEIFNSGKVVGAICHAGSLLASANVLRGKTITCFMAIKDDMINAGGNYIDKEVVRDGNLITSRTPQDLPAFSKEIINALTETKSRSTT